MRRLTALDVGVLSGKRMDPADVRRVHGPYTDWLVEVLPCGCLEIEHFSDFSGPHHWFTMSPRHTAWAAWRALA